ncbi:MAG TPA: acyl-CoA dehydrogenase family protein [Steroidobacteraceae bacterium]|nr:acyl-CoA dehydrogenase family protein [Steroidobacteraceae bacterium]
MTVAEGADDDELIAMLRQSIERYTAEHYTFEGRWAALKSPRAYSEQAWSDYGHFGWLALRLPQESGGVAAGVRTTAPLMEAVGARLLLEPILASAIVGTGLILRRASADQKAQLLPKLADGTLKVAFAHQETLNAFSEDAISSEYRGGAVHGSKVAVLHADCANRLIVSARKRDVGGTVSLYIVDAVARGLRRQRFRLLDGRGAANLSFDGVEAEPLNASGAIDADQAAIAAALEEAIVASCSEALGAIRALNAATNQYLKSRKQFGRPIGANQALQHRMVEMHLLEQEVRALTLAAQRALSELEVGRTRIISGARAFTCSAARRIAAEAVQMHGGIGVSDELDVSHYYRRLMVLGTLFGNRECHFGRFAATCEAIGH